jgi:hypothetical protein
VVKLQPARRGQSEKLMEITKTGRKKMGKRMVDRGRLDYAKKMGLLDARIASSAPCEEWHVLPDDFSPGNWDVICQGGRESFEHSKSNDWSCCFGNEIFSKEPFFTEFSR